MTQIYTLFMCSNISSAIANIFCQAWQHSVEHDMKSELSQFKFYCLVMTDGNLILSSKIKLKQTLCAVLHPADSRCQSLNVLFSDLLQVILVKT